MADVAAVEEQDETTARDGRSPAYPYIPLKQAIDRALALRGAVKQGEARIATAGSVWKLGPKSSGLRSTLAALKQFGLIQYIGSGAERKIKMTEDTNRLYLDTRPNSPDRDAIIIKLAKLPKAHAAFWEKWGADLPPDVEILAELKLELGFSESGASEFLAEYKATLEFAKLIGSGSMPDEESGKLDTPSSQTPERAKVTTIQGQRQTAGAISERIVYKPGQDISVGFSTEPDVAMYEFLKDYLDFRITQMKKQKSE
jgi:hypothetical protein